MAAGLAEHLDKQVGAAIDDFRRVVEVGRGVDHAKELDDEVDAVERAKRVTHGREQSEADQPGAPVALLDADIGAELTGQMNPVLARTLAGEVEDVAGEPI